MNASPGIAFTVMIFALVIGVLVFVHEFGHYGVALALKRAEPKLSLGTHVLHRRSVATPCTLM